LFGGFFKLFKHITISAELQHDFSQISGARGVPKGAKTHRLKSRGRSASDRRWQTLLAESILDAEDLARRLPADPDTIRRVAARYPLRIPPPYLDLIHTPGDPLWRQAVPDHRELESGPDLLDPLHESRQSPVPQLIHRYPNRVVLLISNRCALYCRFCMRKRQVGRHQAITWDQIRRGIAYIRANEAIAEVVLSGGDPLLRPDEQLADILAALRAIPHLAVIRIHTRAPATLPQRITPALAALLRRFAPVWVNTHFNHPAELTANAARACARLADAGIPLGCQTVLLRGVNDAPQTLQRLFRGLLRLRVQPYYLHHLDRVAGTRHFRVPLSRGVQIMQTLQKEMSGWDLPRYVLDLPGGGGKIPLQAAYVRRWSDACVAWIDHLGRRFDGPLH
jgi:lysine 2,3-aminomutase